MIRILILAAALLQGCALAIQIGPVEFGIHARPNLRDPDWKYYRTTAECKASEPERFHPECEWIDRWVKP